MALNLEQKKEVVAELAEVASSAMSLVAAKYDGLTVAHLTDLRVKARKNGVYLRVVKNTLARRAVKGTEFECVSDALTGPLLYAFSKEDPGAAGRLIKDFAKTNDKLVAKVVSVGGKLYGAAELERLASLPRALPSKTALPPTCRKPGARYSRRRRAPTGRLSEFSNRTALPVFQSGVSHHVA